MRLWASAVSTRRGKRCGRCRGRLGMNRHRGFGRKAPLRSRFIRTTHGMDVRGWIECWIKRCRPWVQTSGRIDMCSVIFGDERSGACERMGMGGSPCVFDPVFNAFLGADWCGFVNGHALN